MPPKYSKDDKEPTSMLQLTKEDLLDIVKATKMSPEEIAGIVELARKPDVATQSKIDREEKELQERRDRTIADAKLEEALRAQRQRNCSHKRPDGKSLVMGQVHSDGMIHGLCFRCQKLATPRPVPQQYLAQGVG